MKKEMDKYYFDKEKFNKTIKLLKSIYKQLFIEMLDYKSDKVEEDYKEMEYYQLSPLIRVYYPQFSDNITLLNVSFSNTDETYIDTINTFLLTYKFFKENYKKEYDEEKYKDVDIESITFDE